MPDETGLDSEQVDQACSQECSQNDQLASNMYAGGSDDEDWTAFLELLAGTSEQDGSYSQPKSGYSQLGATDEPQSANELSRVNDFSSAGTGHSNLKRQSQAKFRAREKVKRTHKPRAT